MGDLWQDEGFGERRAVGDASGDDDWDEGDESLETSLEDGFDDPDELDDDELGDEDDEDARWSSGSSCRSGAWCATTRRSRSREKRSNGSSAPCGALRAPATARGSGSS